MTTMKVITITEMKRLAEYYGGTLTTDAMPSIEFDGYGIQATEQDEEGHYYGFKFFGHASNQENVIDLWTELTEEQIKKQLLTIELAKSLIGKTIVAAYTSSGHEHEMQITINDVVVRNEKAIGQSTTHYLIFIEEGAQKGYIYEWQGIFRVSGSAHKVFLKKIN